MAQLIGFYLTIAKAAIVRPCCTTWAFGYYLSKRQMLARSCKEEKIRCDRVCHYFRRWPCLSRSGQQVYTVTKAAFYATVVSVIVTVFSFAMYKEPARRQSRPAGCAWWAKSGAETS